MQKIAFYSWQSDLPNATNRGFIQQALEKAAAKIASDDAVAVEPVIDRDTKGVAGSPDIANTIFGKIAACDVFIADVSIINQEATGRHTPNPNVLIELGYALRTLSFERVILVFNLAYGKLEDLPFDLRMRRVMTYNVFKESESKAEERKKLESTLEEALRAAIQHIPKAEPELPVETPSLLAIEEDKSNKVLIVRRDLKKLIDHLVDLAPEKISSGGTAQEMVDALNQTVEIVADFSKIAEIAAAMKDKVVLLEIFKWFGQIFDRYNISADFEGRISDGDFDYYRFIGHEMMTTLFAFLIREEDWDLIQLLLDTPIAIKFNRATSTPADVYYDFACQWLRGIEGLQRSMGKVTLHGYLLGERHKNGALSKIMPVNQFASADLFLYLHSEIAVRHDPLGRELWKPWSIMSLKEYPLYLKRAEKITFALTLAKLFNQPTIDQLKSQLQEKVPAAKRLFTGTFWDLPIRHGDLKSIGTV
jgi:hypothetical protein